MSKLKTYTIVLEWGEHDEGLYHWAGQAVDIGTAEQLARMEMDRSYNESYWAEGDDPENKRGMEGGSEPTDYAIVECTIGVNEFAAQEMLDTLKATLPHISSEVEQRKFGGNDEDYAALEAVEAQVIKAIAHGEGRDLDA